MRAIIYRRVSTRRQQEEGDSLEGQDRRGRAYAESQDWEVVDSLAEAQSGKDAASRMVLQSILTRDDFEKLIVFKMSRFGRNARDTLNLIHQLQESGKEVVFMEDGLDTGNTKHRLLITILAAVAETELENMRDQVLLGMEEGASKGRWMGGPSPWGTQVHNCEDYGHNTCPLNGQLEEHPQESEEVSKAVSMIIDGATTGDVARSMNAMGLTTPRGKQFTAERILLLMRSDNLRGVYG